MKPRASVDPECPLTDREILARANAAKAFAKTARKGSIAAAEAPGWAPALVERELTGPARQRAR
jgi:hypothetical protein